MAKTVYPGGELPHLWAHQTQGYARNAQGNRSFCDEAFSSYSTVVARRIKGTRGRVVYLLTTRQYSVTTSRLMGELREALRHETCFFADRIDTNENALKSMRADVDATMRAMGSPRIRESTRGKLAEQMRAQIDKANSFAEFVGDRKRLKMPANLDEAIARAKAKNLAKERSEQKRIVAAIKAFETQLLPGWKETGRLDPDASMELRKKYGIVKIDRAYLRIAGEEIVTSHGARVPIEHVRKAMPIVNRILASGETYKRNGHTIHLGHYALDEIRKDGTVIAGCHVIPRSEVDWLNTNLS